MKEAKKMQALLEQAASQQATLSMMTRLT